MNVTRSILGGVILLAFFGFGCDTKEAKIAVVSAEKAYSGSQLNEKSQQYLQEITLRYQEELVALQKKAEEAQEEEKQTAQTALQEKFAEMQGHFTSEQQRVGDAAQAAFAKAVDACRVKYQYDFILLREAVLSFDAAKDITDLVTQELNAMPFTLGEPAKDSAKAVSPESGKDESPSSPAKAP